MIDFVSANNTCCRTTGSYCARECIRGTGAGGWGCSREQRASVSKTDWGGARARACSCVRACARARRACVRARQRAHLPKRHLVLDGAWVLPRGVKEAAVECGGSGDGAQAGAGEGGRGDEGCELARGAHGRAREAHGRRRAAASLRHAPCASSAQQLDNDRLRLASCHRHPQRSTKLGF